MPDETKPPAVSAVTPPWLDKGLWLAVLVPVAALLNQKLGVALDPIELVAMVLPPVSYIVMHKWKTATILAAQVRAGPVAQ